MIAQCSEVAHAPLCDGSIGNRQNPKDRYKVGGFDRAATLDIVLRAYAVQKGLLRWPNSQQNRPLKIEPTGV